MVFVGIYHDITNDGKTAKAVIPVDKDTALWYIINVNFKENVDIATKIKDYTMAFSTAKILYLEVRKLSKAYKNYEHKVQYILKDVDLTIGKGEFIAL